MEKRLSRAERKKRKDEWVVKTYYDSENVQLSPYLQAVLYDNEHDKQLSEARGHLAKEMREKQDFLSVPEANRQQFMPRHQYGQSFDESSDKLDRYGRYFQKKRNAAEIYAQQPYQPEHFTNWRGIKAMSEEFARRCKRWGGNGFGLVTFVEPDRTVMVGVK